MAASRNPYATGPGPPISILRNTKPNVVAFVDQPLEVNVIDTSISTSNHSGGTGGLGSAGDKSSKSSPSTSGGAGGATTATASPRSMGGLSSMSASPGAYQITDPDSSKSNSPGSRNGGEENRVSTYESEVAEAKAASEVILRRGSRKSASRKFSYSNEAGRLLKSALDKHFRNTNISNAEHTTKQLDNYISEVFYQLDYHRIGTISREDFQILCEVLDLKIFSRPPSSNSNLQNTTYRLSGLEWLSSYRPKSPLSPLRMDRLSEVKYRAEKRPTAETGSGCTGSKQQNHVGGEPPNFLFTIGPRPFWELWPQKRRRKRRLNIDEFKRALLEQWARANGMSASRVSALFAPVNPSAVASADAAVTGYRTHRHVRSVRIQPTSLSVNGDAIDGASSQISTMQQHQNGRGVPRVQYETKTKRFFRSLARASRRVHFIRKLSRRIRRNQDQPQKPRITVIPQQQQQQQSRVPVGSHRPFVPIDAVDYATPAPTGSVEKQRQRVNLLEKQIQHQKSEISGLKGVVEDLRSSLQLSDAQNLALQVLLKKMAKEGTDSPVSSSQQSQSERGKQSVPPSSADFRSPEHVVDARVNFRSKIMDESEKHLENLVRELKEMSQTKYPTYNANSNYGGNGTSSTATSVNNFAMFDDDFSHETSNNNRSELHAVQEELESTVGRLQEKEFEVEENSMNLREAYCALEKAQQELIKMR